MKGYCVDVRGFSVDKKKLVVRAASKLIGTCTNWSDGALSGFDVITSTNVYGRQCDGVSYSSSVSKGHLKHLISFNDLMIEAGFNYVEDGVEGFKRKSDLEVKKEIERLDQMVESLNNNSTTVSDLQSEIESLHGQLRSKSEEIGKLNVKLHETEKELSKSRISGAIIFTCLVVVAISNLFFGG